MNDMKLYLNYNENGEEVVEMIDANTLLDPLNDDKEIYVYDNEPTRPSRVSVENLIIALNDNRGFVYAYSNNTKDTTFLDLREVDGAVDRLANFRFRIDTTLGGNTLGIVIRKISGSSSSGGEIDWGDGSIEEYNVTSTVDTFDHVYSEEGEYIVQVSGEFASPSIDTGKNLVTEVLSWGLAGGETRTLALQFRNHINLVSVPTALPINISGAGLESMFSGTTNFNQDLNSWDLSRIPPNILGYYSLEEMFKDSGYNQPLNNWDISNAGIIAHMFQNNTTFNQPLNNWDTRKVFNASATFSGASSFNQDLGSWRLDNIEDMSNIFDNSGMSPENFSRTLVGWANYLFNLDSPPTGVPLGADNVTASTDSFGDIAGEFSNATEARAYLTDTLNWIITGGDIVVPPIATFASEVAFENDNTLTTENTISGLDFVEIQSYMGTPGDFKLMLYHSEPSGPFTHQNQNGVWGQFDI